MSLKFFYVFSCKQSIIDVALFKDLLSIKFFKVLYVKQLRGFSCSEIVEGNEHWIY